MFACKLYDTFIITHTLYLKRHPSAFKAIHSVRKVVKESMYVKTGLGRRTQDPAARLRSRP